MAHMYTIRHPVKNDNGSTEYLEIKIGLIRIDRLIPHEKTRKEELDKLKNTLKQSNFLWHPVIVDRTSFVILDGTHRVMACKELGFKFIGAAFFDAMNESVKIGKWNRTFYSGNYPDNTQKFVEQLGFTTEIAKYKLPDNPDCFYHWDDIIKERNGHGALIDLKGKQTILVAKEEKKAKEKFDDIRNMEKAFIASGYTMSCLSYKKIIGGLDKYKFDFIFIPPRLEKEEIFDTAQSGKVFTPKVSRFYLPVRPLFADFPIEMFCYDGGKSLDEICRSRNEELIDALAEKTLDKIKGGITLERFYQEDYIYMFDLEKRTDLYKKFKNRIESRRAESNR